MFHIVIVLPRQNIILAHSKLLVLFGQFIDLSLAVVRAYEARGIQYNAKMKDKKMKEIMTEREKKVKNVHCTMYTNGSR